jgi:hypothetical protein
MNRALTLVMCVVAALALVATVGGQPAHAATCADYPNQAAAQHAADTRDVDGDGVYCESLPCQCAKPAGDSGGGAPKPAPPGWHQPGGLRAPERCAEHLLQLDQHLDIRRHFLDALRKGWPRTLVLNRPGADGRRDRLLARYPTCPGQDRDEYPPTVGRGKGLGLERGVNPTGWRADVRYVPSGEHGSTLGAKLRRLYNGTRFRYVFY